MKPSAYDKELANRSRIERGFPSFKAWSKANRKAAKSLEARARSKRNANERARAQTLADALNYEHEKLIQPNL